jgi:hypothetical protein
MRQVCRFKMVGVPQEHVVSNKMVYKGMVKSKWVYQTLAGPRRQPVADEAGPSKKRRR